MLAVRGNKERRVKGVLQKHLLKKSAQLIRSAALGRHELGIPLVKPSNIVLEHRYKKTSETRPTEQYGISTQLGDKGEQHSTNVRLHKTYTRIHRLGA